MRRHCLRMTRLFINTFTNTFFDSIKIYTNGKGAVARNITITGIATHLHS